MLTVSQKQSMLDSVKREITFREDYINSTLKLAARRCFELSDKNNDSEMSKLAFLSLNKIRTEIRKHKQRISQLAAISKQLKHEIRRNPMTLTKVIEQAIRA